LAAFALVVQQHELDDARDDFLPDGGADLVVSDARREVLHRVSDDVPTFGQISSAKSAN
jgi:hypothetical protein